MDLLKPLTSGLWEQTLNDLFVSGEGLGKEKGQIGALCVCVFLHTITFRSSKCSTTEASSLTGSQSSTFITPGYKACLKWEK